MTITTRQVLLWSGIGLLLVATLCVTIAAGLSDGIVGALAILGVAATLGGTVLLLCLISY